MTTLLNCLTAFFRVVHLDALTKSQLAVMLVLMEQEHTCVAIATATGYDRVSVWQALQKLRQLGDADMMPLRASAHGQIEYVYSLSAKGKQAVKQWLGAFDPVMAQLALVKNAEAFPGKKMDAEKPETKSRNSDEEFGNLLVGKNL